MSTTLATRPYEPSIEEQETIVAILRDRIVDDATGFADGDICEGEPPRARYYLATLAPRPRSNSPDDLTQDRDANSSMGFEIEVDPGTSLRIECEFSVYFRVMPTYAQQLAASEIPLPDAGAKTPSRKGGPTPRVPVRHVYSRVAFAPITVTALVGSETAELGTTDFADAFNHASAQAVKHDRAFRRLKNIPISALTDEGTYEAFLAGVPSDIPAPAWRAHVALIPHRSRDGRIRVSVLLVNDSVQPTLPAAKQGDDEKQDDDRDHFLFRAKLSARATTGAIKPIKLDLGPDAYRYNGRLAAYALSCGVEAPGWDGSSETIPEIVTLPAPSEMTFRVEPVDDGMTADALRYDLLATDPIPLLKSFATALERYANDEQWSGNGLDAKQQASLAVDHQRALAEVRRFYEGIRWLERDPRLLLAFRLANRTMTQLGSVTGKRNSAWRSFQLVAIVNELPTLAWREHPTTEFAQGLWGDSDDRDPTNAATVVFFPTGGGKTETYLGMTACAMFYDRIRGKGYGITSICRFPLKVLTLNQCQRLVDFIVAGEQVRQMAGAEIGCFAGASTIPFEVGLLIGSDDTPNRLSDGDLLTQLRNDPAARDRTRVVDRCPFCHARAVKVQAPDESRLRLNHVCSSCDRRLPIIITDGEVYRYLPTLVVATIDKLAMIGLSDRFGIALGDVDCECDLHGLSRGGKCVERNLCYKLKGNVTPLRSALVDPSPTFEIVDELHLLTEELGAFDGHYETTLAELQKSLSARLRPDARGVRMKIVATTATIKGEDRQIDHLFGLRSVVTPTAGPKLDETFFWRRNFQIPMRLFLGIQPSHGKTAEMTVVRLLGVVHAAIQDLKRIDPTHDARFEHMTESDYRKLVELYRRSLTYTTSLVDLGKLHRSIPTQVDAYLLDHRYDRIKFEMLYSGSSREGIGEVRRIVEDLEQDEGTTDAVIATSSVSHGLDIDRLNIMLFNGMPKSISEYIQASSRVGRRVKGLVIIIYNPMRERDRSHFRYHGKFHQYLDRMVAPVAINRWSKFAGRRTFPGLFMAYVLQQLNRAWWDAGRAPKHLHQLEQMQQALSTQSMTGAQADIVKSELVRFYNADRPEAIELKAWIETTVDEVLGRLMMAAPGIGGARGGRVDYRGTADFIGTGYKPMISLRDVDAGVAFWPARSSRT